MGKVTSLTCHTFSMVLRPSDSRTKRHYASGSFHALMSLWVARIAPKIPGGLPAHAGGAEKRTTPETNTSLAAKENGGWRIENWKTGYCTHARNLVRNVGHVARTPSE